MHGTGTPLGDPIEMGATAASLLGSPDRGQPILLSAAKSVMGHAEPAAGAVGLLSLLSSLASFQQQPTLHLRILNPLMASAMGAVRGRGLAGGAIARAIGAGPASKADAAGERPPTTRLLLAWEPIYALRTLIANVDCIGVQTVTA